MIAATDYFLSQDGLRLYYRHWDCDAPKMILCIAHGLAEHSGRYDYLASKLNEIGITVFCMDLRGHGESYGKRGHAKSYDLLLSDVEELLKTARSNYTDLPMFLLGHSMGGNLVANFVLTKPVNEITGYILSSPWLKLAFTPPAWKERLADIVHDVWPSLTQPDGLDASQLSRDPEVVEAYKSDPLVHGKISAGLYVAGKNAGIEAIARASEIKVPGYVFHGSEDKIASWAGAKEFSDRNSLTEWKLIDGGYHEVLNDWNKDDAIKMISDWMSNQI